MSDREQRQREEQERERERRYNDPYEQDKHLYRSEEEELARWRKDL